MTTFNAEAAALAQRQLQAALSDALADAAALQAENASLRSDARQQAEQMHRRVVAATSGAAQLETEVASRQSIAQELAAALEHASDERDELLAAAAAAAELRRRLAEVSAERDALSERNVQLQQEAQKLAAAVAEAEAMAGAALSESRRLSEELGSLRGGQAADRAAATAEAADLRRLLELTRTELAEARVAAADRRTDDSRCSAEAADARAERGETAAAAACAGAVTQMHEHAAGLQKLLGASLRVGLRSLPPPAPPVQQLQLFGPQAADPPMVAAPDAVPAPQALPALQYALALALLLRAADDAWQQPVSQAAHSHSRQQQQQHQQRHPADSVHHSQSPAPQKAAEQAARQPLRPATHPAAQPQLLRPPLPPRRKQQAAATPRKRPRFEARSMSAMPSSAAPALAAVALPPAAARRAAPEDALRRLPAPDNSSCLPESSSAAGSTGHGMDDDADLATQIAAARHSQRKQTTVQAPQPLHDEPAAVKGISGASSAAAAGNAALLELLQHLQLEDQRRRRDPMQRDTTRQTYGPAAGPTAGEAAAAHGAQGVLQSGRPPEHAAVAPSAAATTSSTTAARRRRLQWHADGRLRSAHINSRSNTVNKADRGERRPQPEAAAAAAAAGAAHRRGQSQQLSTQTRDADRDHRSVPSEAGSRAQRPAGTAVGTAGQQGAGSELHRSRSGSKAAAKLRQQVAVGGSSSRPKAVPDVVSMTELALSLEARVSRRQSAARLCSLSGTTPAGCEAPAAAGAGGKDVPAVLQQPERPQPLTLSIAAKLSAEIAELDSQHGRLLKENAAARRAAGHHAGDAASLTAETRVRTCGQLLGEVQAAMRERGAQMRLLRAGHPGADVGSQSVT